ncbi:MAG TPA: PilZ domain-containing protein [Nitrospiria bacterium]|nr:PilZ domain-containing protein [Nitrospiria bacterium]
MYTRRKFIRFPVSGSARVKVPEMKFSFQGELEKLSHGGVGISTGVKVKTGTPVALEIQVSMGSDSPETSITGVVRSFSSLGETGLLGIQFDRTIDSDKEPHIYQFLSALEKELITECRWIE